MDFDFIPSNNDLGSDSDVSSPSGDRNKIYDLGICIEVESTKILAPISLVIDTLLPFENEDKVLNHDMLIHGDTLSIWVFVIPFDPLDKAQVWGNRVKLSDLKQALRLFWIFEASRARGFLRSQGNSYSLSRKTANRTKFEQDLKRARKTKAKGAKGLKTELKRTFPDRLDNVCAFNKSQDEAKSTLGIRA
ncbi:hypothetical protein Tco_0601484 [Tanacetum coccineum]